MELYKFYNDSNWAFDALENSYFYFAHPRQLNDPFECLQNRESYITNNPHSHKDIKSHRDNIGICSFTSKWDSNLMWGHYAKNYNGFCLKFNEEKLKNIDKTLIRTHVGYLKDYKPANGELRAVLNYIMSLPIDEATKKLMAFHAQSHFEYIWKYEDWKYENEYRFLTLYAMDNDNKLHFPPEAVEAIYIDSRMNQVNLENYHRLLNIRKSVYPHAKLFSISPNSLIVKLEFEEVDCQN